MFGLISFFVATDSAKTDVSLVEVVPTGLQIGNNLNICVLDKVTNLRKGLVELVGQPVDGVDDRQKAITEAHVSGADIILEWNRVADTFKIGSLPPWSRAKTQAFIDALVAFGLVA